MRKVTQGIVGVISLGVLATSWSLGQAAQSGFTVGGTGAKSVTPVATSAPIDPVTKESDAISYVAHIGHSDMQISVTKKGSTISDIVILNGGTEGGEYKAVPSTLAQAAVQAQGANFGNIGGATHTSDAFKKALESALAKF